MLFSLQYLATHYMCHAKSSQVTTKKNKNNMNSQQNVVPASLIRQTETKLRIKHTQSDAYWATWLRRQSHQLTNEIILHGGIKLNNPVRGLAEV